MHIMKILKFSNSIKSEIIKEAVNCLKNGGIVIYPTETCYGVGVDATNKVAVSKVLEYKERPEGKPISIAVSNKEMASKYVEINDRAINIYDNLLPGPITVISKSLGNVSKQIESEKGTLGIRIPDHEVPLSIVEKLERPITSTSANMSGKKTPYTVSDILDNLPESKKEMIDLIIDFGTLAKNPPSTVLDTTSLSFETIRGGDITFGAVNESFRLQNEGELNLVVDYFYRKYYKKDNKVIIKLNGSMGAGKTHFVKYLAKFLNSQNRISSPTFTLHHEYDFEDNKLHHIDLWRIETSYELSQLRLNERVKSGDIVAIEWASKFNDQIDQLFAGATIVNIYIKIISENGRSVFVSS